MRRRGFLLALLVAAATVPGGVTDAGGAWAAEVLIGNFGDWSAFRLGTGKDRVCYIASVPKKETGDYESRGNTYLLMTHRPAKKERDVVELRAGYTYKEGSEVTFTIDGEAFELFTDGGTAWAREVETDTKLAIAMIKGKELVVKGVSSRGTLTTDTYSLIGFTAAYRAIGSACGVAAPTA